MQNRLEEVETKLLRAEELDPDYWSAQTSLFSFYYNYSDKPDRYKLATRHAVRLHHCVLTWRHHGTIWGTANYMLMQYGQAPDAWQHSFSIERHPEALFRATLVYCKDSYTNTCFSLLEEMVDKGASYRQFIDITDPILKDLNSEESKHFQAIVTTS